MPEQAVVLLGQASEYRSLLQKHLTTHWEISTWVPEDSRDQLFQLGASARAVVLGADIVLSDLVQVCLAATPNIELLQIPYAGYNRLLPLLGALPARCNVCNTYGNEVPVAEYVMLAMLESEIQLARISADFKAGSWKWAGQVAAGQIHGELYRKTVGIVGFGRVGSQIALRAAPFGVRLVAVARSPRPTKPERLDWFGTTERLDELLAESDYVVLACPLTERTRGLLDSRRISIMKPTAVLINVSRAEVVDEEALYIAVRDRTIRGAVSDVWYVYPNPRVPSPRPASRPFHELDNITMTPHCASWTEPMLERRWIEVARNLDHIVRCEPLDNIVKLAHAPDSVNDFRV